MLVHTIHKAGMLYTLGGVKLKEYHKEEIKTGRTLHKRSEYLMCTIYAYRRGVVSFHTLMHKYFCGCSPWAESSWA